MATTETNTTVQVAFKLKIIELTMALLPVFVVLGCNRVPSDQLQEVQQPDESIVLVKYPKPYLDVSIIQLVSSPDLFSNQDIRICGFFKMKYRVVYLNEQDASYRIDINGIELEIPSAEDYREFDRQYVSMTGEFVSSKTKSGRRRSFLRVESMFPLSKTGDMTFESVFGFSLSEYSNEIKAGDVVSLKRKLVIRNTDGNSTSEVREKGTIYFVLMGNEKDPTMVWLGRKLGSSSKSTWLLEEFQDWYEKTDRHHEFGHDDFR